MRKIDSLHKSLKHNQVGRAVAPVGFTHQPAPDLEIEREPGPCEAFCLYFITQFPHLCPRRGLCYDGWGNGYCQHDQRHGTRIA